MPAKPSGTSQIEILRLAEELAAALQQQPENAVKRNTFLSLVADFQSHPDPDRLRRTLELLLKGSGGHLARGGNYEEQVVVATREISRVLRRGDLSVDEYRSLFGWTARLLESPGSTGSRRTNAPGGGGSKTGTSAPRSHIGSVKPGQLQALEELRRQLAEEENGGE